MVASSASGAPLVATITGSNTIGRSGCSCFSCSSRWAICSAANDAADHPDLDRIDADVLDHRVDLREDHLGRHRMHRR